MGSAVERFVQAVRLASCDLNVKTGGGQGETRFYPPNSSLVSVDHSLDNHLIWKTALDEVLADYFYKEGIKPNEGELFLEIELG